MVIDATAYFWTIFIWIVFPIAGALCAGVLCEMFFLKGLEADEGDVEVEEDRVVIVVDDLEPDFEIDVEIDAGVDLLAWETADDTQKAACRGFFMQGGEQCD